MTVWRPTCEGCGASILWVKTAKGKSMPLDVALVRRLGKAVLWRDDGTQAFPDGAGVTVGHESHFATCPKAQQFRRRA